MSRQFLRVPAPAAAGTRTWCVCVQADRKFAGALLGVYNERSACACLRGSFSY